MAPSNVPVVAVILTVLLWNCDGNQNFLQKANEQWDRGHLGEAETKQYGTNEFNFRQNHFGAVLNPIELLRRTGHGTNILDNGLFPFAKSTLPLNGDKRYWFLRAPPKRRFISKYIKIYSPPTSYLKTFTTINSMQPNNCENINDPSKCGQITNNRRKLVNLKKQMTLASDRLRSYWFLKKHQKGKNLLFKPQTRYFLRKSNHAVDIFSPAVVMKNNSFQPEWFRRQARSATGRNFLWFGKAGKPLILLRLENGIASVLGTPNTGNNGSKRNTIPPKDVLVALGQLIPAFEEFKFRPDTSSFFNKHAGNRIRNTWFLKGGTRTPLGRLLNVSGLWRKQFNPSSFARKHKLFLKSRAIRKMQSRKRKNMKGRLRATWFRGDLFPPINDVTFRSSTYLRGANNGLEEISPRLQSIWLASLKKKKILHRTLPECEVMEHSAENNFKNVRTQDIFSTIFGMERGCRRNG